MSKIYVDEIAGIASPSTVAIPGHVIQVVQGTSRAFTEVSSDDTWTSLGVAASITPSSTSSKILITCQINFYVDRVGSNDNRGAIGIYRGSTQLGPSMCNLRAYDRGGSGIQLQAAGHLCYLDSPSTTSSTTYTIYGYRKAGTSTMAINGNESISFDGLSTGGTTITLMEIAG